MNHYEMFQAIVEQGSFNRAADSLGVSQPTISKNVDRLESEMGLTLIKRSTKELQLTAPGREFYERCCQINSLIQDTERAMKRHRSSDGLDLKVASSVHIASLFFPLTIKAVLEEYPDARIFLHTDIDFSSYYRREFSMDYDLFIYEGEPQESDLVYRRIAEVPLGYYAAPEYLANNGGNDLEYQMKHGRLLLTSSVRFKDWQEKLVSESSQVGWKTKVVCNEGGTLVELAKAGLGIIMTADYMVRGALCSGELVELKSIAPLAPLPICAVFRKEYFGPIARSFLEKLVEKLEVDYQPAGKA